MNPPFSQPPATKKRNQAPCKILETSNQLNLVSLILLHVKTPSQKKPARFVKFPSEYNPGVFLVGGDLRWPSGPAARPPLGSVSLFAVPSPPHEALGLCVASAVL